jgi:hypothetical protein
MTVFTGSPYVMAETTLTTDHPIIGYWQGNVTTSNVVSSNGSDPNFPVSNLANPATYLKWQSASMIGTDTLTISFGATKTIDFVALQGINFGIGSIITISYATTNSPSDLITLVTAATTNLGILLYRFTPISAGSITISISEGSSPTVIRQIAGIYTGKLLVVQRRIYANHTPLSQARFWKATDGMSESGQFLGRIILQEYKKNTVPLQLLDPAWYRANFDPFLATADERPFFFAWRPATYADEIGYAELTSMPAPIPTPPSNLISLSLSLSGVT